jgi:hypothetical protein
VFPNQHKETRLKRTTTHYKVPVRTAPLPPPPLPWPNQKPWKWSDKQQDEIDTMKRIIAREPSIMAYPNFEIPFEVHTDASAFQLGAVISQNGKPIAFYSRKLTPTQKRYTPLLNGNYNPPSKSSKYFGQSF